MRVCELLYNPVTNGFGNGFAEVVHVQLLIYFFNAGFDGVWRKAEFIGDKLYTIAVGEELKHLAFTFCEFKVIEWCLFFLLEKFNYFFCDQWRHRCTAIM